MIYDKLQVALLAVLLNEREDSANALIAQYLLCNAGDPASLSIKAIASACHVGTGTVSRFAKEAGFGSFAELRDACADSSKSFERMGGDNVRDRAEGLARRTALSVAQAAASVDVNAVSRLVADLNAYEKVSAYGLLKAQAAALDLQVDLLMQNKRIDTCSLPAEQGNRMAAAHRDELVIIFSYTGTYFDANNVGESLRRSDRPKIWMVCGDARNLPPFVADCVTFVSDHSRFGHPYQLECVAGIIAQEYAASLEQSDE